MGPSLSTRYDGDELIEPRRRLELAIDGAKLGTWTFDLANGVGWYSDRSREMMGLAPDTAIDARTVKSFLHPDDWVRIARPYFEGFPHERLEAEYRVIRPSDGATRWIYALGASDGASSIVHGIHLDITDRKQAELDLAHSREALHQSEKLAALGSLLAGVSHELNNPLAAIVGQAEMLLEDCAGTPIEERARKIGAAAERCARIVRTFLAMARRREPERAPVDANRLVAAALELTEYALRTAGIVVHTDYGDPLPVVEGDRDQLHQVLVNLIVNAQQAMESGDIFVKTLSLRTSLNAAGEVQIDVRDTGPGIGDDVRARIFEPFFTTKDHAFGGGTGIGLSFSQNIVEAHGGNLSVEPSERGAHFRLQLPAAEAVATGERREAAAAVPGKSRRVLIVEDEADVADTLRELIAREGFEVTVARDGTEAFFALDKGDFDILFSDLRMPRLNGPELFKRLCEIRPELVAHMAFVTGDTVGDNMGEFLRDCGRPILEKPFTKAGIRAVLAALVEP